MYKILGFLVLALIAYIGFVSLTSSSSSDKKEAQPVLLKDFVENNGTISMDRNGNHVEFKESEDFAAEYRVFVIDANPDKKGPKSYIDAYLKVLPIERDKALANSNITNEEYNRLESEEVLTLPVIFSDKTLKNTVLALKSELGKKRLVLYLTGSVLEESKHSYNGKDMEPVLEPVNLSAPYLVNTADQAQW